ncbi:MAG: glycosyltransferase [Verrucomicrobiota bacterium JB024]|nr:glycosyltransferase [Verrucomicrobiota bacterium JB024]
MPPTPNDSPAAEASAPLRMGVVMPLANEEQTIDGLLARVLVQLGPEDRVFCILDNVCKDRTREVISGWQREKDARVTLVWAPENRCVVDAYFRGYREACAAGCRWILEMDGGLSHLPEQIPQFIAGMEEGYDYVGGSRYLDGGCHDSFFTRRLLSKGGTILARGLLKAPMSDMTSGFECFTREALLEVLERGVRSRAHFFQTEIRCMMSKRRWKEVPIRYANTYPTVAGASIADSLRVLFALWKERGKSR